jgi:hypothetical protein
VLELESAKFTGMMINITVSEPGVLHVDFLLSFVIALDKV